MINSDELIRHCQLDTDQTKQFRAAVQAADVEIESEIVALELPVYRAGAAALSPSSAVLLAKMYAGVWDQ